MNTPRRMRVRQFERLVCPGSRVRGPESTSDTHRIFTRRLHRAHKQPGHDSTITAGSCAEGPDLALLLGLSYVVRRGTWVSAGGIDLRGIDLSPPGANFEPRAKAKQHVTMGGSRSVRVVGEGLATLDLRGSYQGACARVQIGARQVPREGTRRLVPLRTSSSSTFQSISPVS